MLSQLSPKERFGYVAVIAVALFGAGFVGMQHLKSAPTIKIENGTPERVSTVGTGQAGVQSLPNPSTVQVHVAGAVKRPGVIELSSNSRVKDAIDAAGGPASSADLEDLNLAAKLVDGTQLFVPSKAPMNQARSSGKPAVKSPRPTIVKPSIKAPIAAYRANPKPEAVYSARPDPVTSEQVETRPNAAPPKNVELAPSSININTASATELDRLPGVGPVTAAKIIDYRKQHGGFSSIDELLAVKGIGPKKLEAMRKYCRI